MPMPSLFKYFVFVGAALLALLSLANFLLEPSTGARVVETAAKPVPVVRHEPGASRIERWRNEQAALKAAEQTQTAENASVAAKSVAAAPAPLRPALTPVEPAAAQAQIAGASPQVEPAAAVQAEATESAQAAEEAEATRIKAEKAKAAKARKAKLARERARAEQMAQGQGGPYYGGPFYGGMQQRSASSQQDQYYYGQRAPMQRQAGYAYAPRQSFGPFGFGQGW